MIVGFAGIVNPDMALRSPRPSKIRKQAFRVAVSSVRANSCGRLHAFFIIFISEAVASVMQEKVRGEVPLNMAEDCVRSHLWP